MKNFNKLVLSVIAVSALLFTSCSKKKDANAIDYINSGSISGTLIGTSTDGQVLNESFNFTDLMPGEQYSCTADTSTMSSYNTNTGAQMKTPITTFSIHRYSSDALNEMKLSFVIDNSNIVLATTMASFSLDYSKQLTNGSYLQYFVDQSDIKKDLTTGQIIPSNFTITNFSYDKSSGLVSGDYNIMVYTVNSKNTSESAVIKGSFSVNVYSSVR